MNTPHTPGPDTKQLTPRIRLEHVQRGKVWRWAVIVDARAEELFVSRDDAITFARGVDIGHSWSPAFLSQRNELREALQLLMFVAEHMDIAQGFTMQQLFPIRFDKARAALNHAKD